jgi:digeranylgeranylglycerophospholipid reductase
METYDQLWHSWVAPKMRTRLLMTELLYLATNERYDELIHDLDRMDEERLAEVNRANPLAVLRLFRPSDLSLLKRFVRERYLN